MRKTLLIAIAAVLAVAVVVPSAIQSADAAPGEEDSPIEYYSYSYEDGVLKRSVMEVTSYGIFTNGMDAINASPGQPSYFYVDEKVSVNGNFSISGEVHLILSENAEIEVYNRVIVNYGSSLHIHSTVASLDSGVLGKISAIGMVTDGSLNIHGGDIQIDVENRGDNDQITYSAGIGGSYDPTGGYVQPIEINIYNGKVTSTNSEHIGLGASYGATYGTTINIHGGEVRTSTSGPDGSGVDLGESTIGSGYTTINITGGKVFAKNIKADDIDMTGGALFFNKINGKTPSELTQSDITFPTGSMQYYNMSEEHRNLQLYADAYQSGRGCLYGIDHIHNQNNKVHEQGQSEHGDFHHYHCDYDRGDGDSNGCYYISGNTPHQYHYTSNGQYTHNLECFICGWVIDNEVHEPVGTPVNEGDAGHSYTCADCGQSGILEPHTLESFETTDSHHIRKCVMCDYLEYGDLHYYQYDKTYHQWVCGKCGDFDFEPHVFTCQDIGGGMHRWTCFCGEYYDEPHSYVDGECPGCGALHPGLIGGGGVDDIYPPAWGYDENAQTPPGKDDENWLAVAIAATAATIMAVFIIWERKR